MHIKPSYQLIDRIESLTRKYLRGAGGGKIPRFFFHRTLRFLFAWSFTCSFLSFGFLFYLFSFHFSWT